MTYLLDTNVCVTHLRQKPGADAIDQKLAAVPPDDVFLCSVVKAELRYGAERSQDPAKNHSQLDTFFAAFASLSFDDSSADRYALSIGQPSSKSSGQAGVRVGAGSQAC